jgi:choline-sulfatase
MKIPCHSVSGRVLSGSAFSMRAIAATLLFFTLVLSLSKGELAQSRPNILLITLDTVRADRMGFLGSTRGLTPALDALAKQATVYARAYAQAPITTVSHATILSGTYPPFHSVRDFGVPLPDSVPYLPDIAHRAGYRTAAFVGSLILDPRAGTAPGFDRGFDVYDAGFRLRRPGEDRYKTVERRGDEVVARALRWLGRSQGAQPEQPEQGAQPLQPAQRAQPLSPTPPTRPTRPFFVWVHLFDAHDPYDPPGALKARYAAAPYDGEIAAVDRAVGRLVQAAGADTLIVVAADHGEALGDHGEDTHGVFLYDETLHAPLVVRIPGRPGARVSSRVRLADVAPTILEAAGLPVPPAMQGESLVRLTASAEASALKKPDAPYNPANSVEAPGRSAAEASGRTVVGASGFSRTPISDRPVYAETDYPRQAFGWSSLLSWRTDQFLFVRAPKRELYDQRSDARAAKNLAGAQRAVADRLNGELDQFIRRTAGAGGPAASTDPALSRRLASLGYVGGAGSGSSASNVDPKDRIEIANTLRNAIAAVEDGAFQRAIPLLERVTANEPTIPIAQLNLGVARARQRQWKPAIDTLHKAITLDPESMLAHYELASAYYESGDLQSAAAHFGVVASRLPKWADARYSLASVYARIDRVDEAVAELRAALALEPRHFRANLLLGRILTLRGQAAAALPHLQTAAGVQPTDAEAHRFLADAYDKVGNAAEAAKARRRAEELIRK